MCVSWEMCVSGEKVYEWGECVWVGRICVGGEMCVAGEMCVGWENVYRHGWVEHGVVWRICGGVGDMRMGIKCGKWVGGMGGGNVHGECMGSAWGVHGV